MVSRRLISVPRFEARWWCVDAKVARGRPEPLRVGKVLEAAAVHFAGAADALRLSLLSPVLVMKDSGGMSRVKLDGTIEPSEWEEPHSTCEVKREVES